MSGDSTGYIQNVQMNNGKLKFTSNGQWYEITTDASRSGFNLTFLFNIYNGTKNISKTEFDNYLSPYTLISIVGTSSNYSAASVVSSNYLISNNFINFCIDTQHSIFFFKSGTNIMTNGDVSIDFYGIS